MSVLSGKEGGRADTPAGLKGLAGLLIAFALFAFAGSVFLWGRGFILSPPPGTSIAVPLADILINAPASLLAGVGLWRRRRYGYRAGYLVAGIYLYASTFIIVEALERRPPDFWAILVPQLLALGTGAALLLYLPRVRDRLR